MTDVEQQLRGLLRERAVPPAAPAGRYETVRQRGRLRRRLRRLALAGVATTAVAAGAVAVPAALHGGRDAAAVPSHPSARRLSEVTRAVVDGRQITADITSLGCDGAGRGVAWLAGGAWHLAVWTPGSHGGACISMGLDSEVRVPLSQPYAGQPVIDEATGKPAEVNGGPGFRLPTYRPPGYALAPGDQPQSVRLTGPGGTLLLLEGGPDVGSDLDNPTWQYDVLDRPAIAGHRALLIRYRQSPDWVELRWTGPTRTVRIQAISATLDPDEVVKVARSIPTG